MWHFLKSIFKVTNYLLPQLSVFFNDFADLQNVVHRSKNLLALNETTSNTILKEALKKIGNFINDGRSLEEAFENTKVFPKIVSFIERSRKNRKYTRVVNFG